MAKQKINSAKSTILENVKQPKEFFERIRYNVLNEYNNLANEIINDTKEIASMEKSNPIIKNYIAKKTTLETKEHEHNLSANEIINDTEEIITMIRSNVIIREYLAKKTTLELNKQKHSELAKKLQNIKQIEEFITIPSQMRLYGLGVTSPIFFSEEELDIIPEDGVCENFELDVNSICPIEYIGDFDGFDDVIREISKDGEIIFYTNRVSQGIMAGKINDGKISWEDAILSGDLDKAYEEFEQRGITLKQSEHSRN